MIQTASNSAVPVGYRKKIASDAGMDAPKHAAGILFVAPDGDVLVLRRSSKEANYSGHWALPGGGVDAGETPHDGALREAREEMGVDVKTSGMKTLDRRITPTGLTFHTFAGPVGEKFVPKLNDEHSGFAWAPLDQLPQPLHPAVKQTLQDQLGMADDMTPEDWSGLRDGFLKWTAEEEQEPEHASDAEIIFALDESVRELDGDGRLHVAITNISKATVNPYRGKEIPNYQALGLDPQKVYQLLRDPVELEKAASTFNGIQVLQKHIPVKASDHQPYDVVGATGTDAVFENPYLKNSIVVWVQSAIDAIDADRKKELSCAYRYRADMTPGVFNGMRYDGVMRDIVGNHVALVKDGRAGPDVVVGDSKENLDMKPTKFSVLALRATAAALAPLMAMDAKPITLSSKDFKDLSTKTYEAQRPALVAALKKATDGKLAQDADLEQVVELLDHLGASKKAGVDEVDPSAGSMTDTTVNPMAAMTKDSGVEGLKGFLKERGMGEDDIKRACDMMMPKAADESPEDKAAREEKEKAAADAKRAMDAETPEQKKEREDKEKAAKDAAMKDMVTKPAMDAAIDSAVKSVRATEQGIRSALSEVRPYVGELPATLAFDSAEGVYRHTLKALGVEGHDTIHASALPTILKLQAKPGARPADLGNSQMAMDAAGAKSFTERFPNAGRIARA